MFIAWPGPYWKRKLLSILAHNVYRHIMFIVMVNQSVYKPYEIM